MRIKSRALRVILSVLFVAAVAAVGTLFTDTTSEWYQNLIKPELQPPGIVFAVAWTVLYGLIAASLSLVAVREHPPKKTLLAVCRQRRVERAVDLRLLSGEQSGRLRSSCSC